MSKVVLGFAGSVPALALSSSTTLALPLGDVCCVRRRWTRTAWRRLWTTSCRRWACWTTPTRCSSSTPREAPHRNAPHRTAARRLREYARAAARRRSAALAAAFGSAQSARAAPRRAPSKASPSSAAGLRCVRARAALAIFALRRGRRCAPPCVSCRWSVTEPVYGYRQGLSQPELDVVMAAAPKVKQLLVSGRGTACAAAGNTRACDTVCTRCRPTAPPCTLSCSGSRRSHVALATCARPRPRSNPPAT